MEPRICFEITGRTAHTRIAPLLPADWIDCSPYAPQVISASSFEDKKGNKRQDNIQFLWENSPRYETRAHRDTVACYSHLPNGIAILDDKWTLARIFSDEDGGLFLESHCFRGVTGFRKFCSCVDIFHKNNPEVSEKKSNLKFPDLLHRTPATNSGEVEFPSPPSNLWVVKDANSNGAGGIWIMSPLNASSFLSSSTYLKEKHRYVAQRYAWPPVLYGGRKCHVRAYALFTSDGRAFVHRRAFLHVANEFFSYDENSDDKDKEKTAQEQEKGEEKKEADGAVFESSVHITNCCANSHDPTKFSGEICADFEKSFDACIGYQSFQDRCKDDNGGQEIPLAEFYPSVSKAVKALARKTFPFLRGGEVNNGFEYLGLDFILSYRQAPNKVNGERDLIPLAYLLEVNAPPSQDTATGLTHAEALHDEVLRDIMSLWVVPKVTARFLDSSLVSKGQTGGWKCVYDERTSNETANDGSVVDGFHRAVGVNMILPTNAAILNKIRWAIYERKTAKIYNQTSEKVGLNTDETSERTSGIQKSNPSTPLDANTISAYARTQFPYFAYESDTVLEIGHQHSAFLDNKCRSAAPIYLENAGGAQVPRSVIQHMSSSLANRHRSLLGSQSKKNARQILLEILGGNSQDNLMFLGPNATILLDVLAQKYLEFGFFGKGDEIVISVENHLANVSPWLKVCDRVGAIVKWWTSSKLGDLGSRKSPPDSSSNLNSLLSSRTRLVAVSHASNVLGQVCDIQTICQDVKRLTFGRAHVIVDGVATAPHIFSDVASLRADWYVVSCHKLFGPHIGGLCGSRHAVIEMETTAGRKAFEDDTGDERVYRLWESGTLNYEGCDGIRGIGEYLCRLSSLKKSRLPFDAHKRLLESTSCHEGTSNQRQHVFQVYDANCTSGERPIEDPNLVSDQFQEAYRRIAAVESDLMDFVLPRLRRCSNVCIVENEPAANGRSYFTPLRIPIVSFWHKKVMSKIIVQTCFDHGIVCRNGTFLATKWLLAEHGIADHCNEEGVVRISFSHYNTINEARRTIDVLESIFGWW